MAHLATPTALVATDLLVTRAMVARLQKRRVRYLREDGRGCVGRKNKKELV